MNEFGGMSKLCGQEPRRLVISTFHIQTSAQDKEVCNSFASNLPLSQGSQRSHTLVLCLLRLEVEETAPCLD